VDEDGGVLVGPRNFYTTKGKSGKIDKSLFMRPSYISQGDPFKQVAIATMTKGTRSADPNGYLKAGHDKPFKPAKVI